MIPLPQSRSGLFNDRIHLAVRTIVGSFYDVMGSDIGQIEESRVLFSRVQIQVMEKVILDIIGDGKVQEIKAQKINADLNK